MMMNKGRGVKAEDREKRVQDVVHPAAGTRRMAVKGEEVQVGCRGISRARTSDRQRSCSWDFDNKPIAARARAALRDVQQQQQQQQGSGGRSMPRASSVNSRRPVVSGGVMEKSALARAGSPVVKANHFTAKRSPALHIYRDESLSRTALSAGKTAANRPGWNKVVNSPAEAGAARRRSGEKSLLARPSPVVHTASRTSANPVQGSAHPEDEEEAEEQGLSSIQSSLHGRLSLLEGRVSQMAAELRETKQLLDASNPISSKVLLTDIHSKIINIERCMTGSPAGATNIGAGRVSCPGRSESTSLRERILQEKEGFQKALQSLTGSSHRQDAPGGESLLQRSSSRRFSRDALAVEATKVKPLHERHTPGSRLSNAVSVAPALDHSRLDIVSHENAQPIFEDYYGESPVQSFKSVKARPSLHQKLVESRATLAEKSKKEREVLCMKLAEFGGRELVDAGDEGALVAAEFLTSLDGDRCFRQEVGKSLDILKVPLKERKASLPLPDSSGHSSSSGSVLSSRKHRYSDEASDTSSSEYSSPSFSQSTGNTTEEQCSTVTMGGEFADIDHLKLSDGNISRQLPKSDTSGQATQFRSADGEVPSDTFSIKDLRCDESVVLEGDDDVEFSVESPAVKDKDEDEGQSRVTGKQLLKIGDKTTTAGWFACEGEGILLAHEDGCCSYHDVANMEEKAVYRVSSIVSPRVWGDCWIIRAPGTDGRSNKFVVAASAGGTADSAFCAWDFYTRKIAAYHCDSSSLASPAKGRSGRASNYDLGAPSSKDPSGPGSNLALRKWLDRSGTFSMTRLGGTTKKTFERSLSMDHASKKRNVAEEIESKPASPPLWWYRPCGPLLASAASGLTTVSLSDIRDGESVMRWDTQKAVAAMPYSSPVQWRNKNKLILAEVEGLSFWDVESLDARRLHSVNLPEKQMRALHVYNNDAECSGGVRQRSSSSDHHSDGILCTNEAVNVLDFRVPTGIAKKFSTLGEETQSIFADGDAVYSGATSFKTRVLGDGSTRLMQPQCRLNQWSIRQGKLMNVYSLPQSNSHSFHLSMTQVWGSSDSIMAANGNGLFVFEPARRHSLGHEVGNVRDVLGSDDLNTPTFDFASSRILLISRDRPAMWCHWP